MPRRITDHYGVIYGVFILFGIIILLPWNIFLSADDYFVKFKLNTNQSRNATFTKHFMLIVSSIGQMTNVIVSVCSIVLMQRFTVNPKRRIPYTILCLVSCMLVHIFLAIIDTSDWPEIFFILCCLLVFVMYIATGILNLCVYYVVSILPMEYINAIILGNNLSGCLTTVLSIISKLTAPDLRIATIFYFGAAIFFLMFAFVGYIIMGRMSFYKYYYVKNTAGEGGVELRGVAADDDETIDDILNNNNEKVAVNNMFATYLQVIKKVWPLLFCIWLNFFSTLAIFPVYTLGITPNSIGFMGNWYHDIVTFLTFNIFVTIGNIIPRFVKWPGQKFIHIVVVLRACCVFGFFLCSNYKRDERNLVPVLVTNDYVYWAGAAASPLTFGYIASLLMMYTIKRVEPTFAGTASMLAALTLIIGVISGLQFSFILDKLAVL